jgi:WD40 repeat protein
MIYSPSGNSLAVGYAGCSGGELEIWDLKNPQQPPAIFQVGGREVETVAYSQDGKWLAFGGDDDSVVRVLDSSNSQSNPIRLPGHEHGVRSIAFAPDNQTLATLDVVQTIRIWDLRNPSTPTKTIPRPYSFLNNVTISPDGKTLLLSSYVLTDIEVWELPDLKGKVSTLKGKLNPETAPVFSPDGRYLAIGASTSNVMVSTTVGLPDAAVELWDMTHPEAGPVLLVGRGGSAVGGVAFSPDGKWLADTRIEMDLVQVWDMADLKAPAKVLSHNSAYSVSFSPDGKTLASGGMDDSIKLWDYRQPAPNPTILADPPPSSP